MEECSESVISESLSKAWVPTWNEAERSEPTLTYSRLKSHRICLLARLPPVPSSPSSGLP